MKRKLHLWLLLPLLWLGCENEHSKLPATNSPQKTPPPIEWRYIEPKVRIEYETGDFDIEYGVYQGRPWSLVSDGFDLRLQIAVKSMKAEESLALLDFLQQEVERLTEPDHFGQRVGQSKFFLKIKGQPTWHPYSLINRDGNYQCLQFATLVSVSKINIIEAIGQDGPNQRGYYPYKITP